MTTNANGPEFDLRFRWISPRIEATIGSDDEMMSDMAVKSTRMCVAVSPLSFSLEIRGRKDAKMECDSSLNRPTKVQPKKNDMSMTSKRISK